MTDVTASTGPGTLTLSIVVLNVDGTVKTDLGVVEFWHRNPLQRLRWRLVGKPAANARIHAHNNKRGETNARSESI